ncbi:MAG TPA: hypothetical protein VJU87_05170 [Gemmatimonadaceae bacterium]|nr:hypothetical protein [Gemmatimonadaceae bacterium]
MLHRLVFPIVRDTARAQARFALAFSLLSPFTALHAQRASAISRPAPSDSLLTAITARGRAIAGYEEAVWQARAASPDPDFSRALQQIAIHTSSGWSVAFGRLSPTHDSFTVEQLATSRAIPFSPDTQFVVHTLATPLADTDTLLRAARALDTAAALFSRLARPGVPYQSVVLPTPGGDWLVYFLPAPTRPGVWPLGGDVRYRISADGERVRDMRRLHLSIIEFDRDSQPDARYTPGSHTTEIDDVPEDTDVAHVLLRRPRVFEYVFTTEYLYMINEDGSIRLVMGRAGLLGMNVGNGG